MKIHNCFRLYISIFHTLCFALLFLITGHIEAATNQAKSAPNDLMELSLEELMTITVTSVSKKEESLFEASSAVFVITQEDIRRSGATVIPELLRMVPGIQVAHVDGNKWAITSRGFNGLFSTKLLVLIDGRSVYTSVFAGVYWDTQDTILEDVERIEVIRGSGGTLWGSNAVNGVINIITKNSEDTQGALLTAGGGNQETGFGSLRYGEKLGKNAHYRAYAKYNKRKEFSETSGANGGDEWNATRGGFRIDWDASKNSSFTFQGDSYYGESSQRITALLGPGASFLTTQDDNTIVSGGNFLTRWKRKLNETSDFELQLYYDRASREELSLGQTVDTFDLDFQHRFEIGDRQKVIWGAGQRVISDFFKNSFSTSLTPATEVNYITSTFVQDEITLIENRFKITVGTKVELNSYTDFEFQPSARFLWTPNKHNSIWGAVSRAVRIPSRTDHDFRLNFAATPGPVVLQTRGNQSFKSEELLAFELGYRVQPNEKLLFDVTGFVNKYDNLSATESGTAFTATEPAPTHTISPSLFDNNMEGEAYGVELIADWKALDIWRLSAGLTWFKLHLHLDPTSANTTAERAEGDNPEYQVNIRSYLQLPHHWEFDTALYFVGDLANQNINAYARVDLRLGWQATENLEFSLSAQNLFDPDHPEFGNQGGVASTEVPRSAFGKMVLKF